MNRDKKIGKYKIYTMVITGLLLLLFGLIMAACSEPATHPGEGGDTKPPESNYWTITFEIEGDTTLVPSQQVLKGNGNYVKRPTVVDIEGYVFGELWSTNTDSFWVSQWYFDDDFSPSVVSNDMTLYGYWDRIAAVVSFESNGGSEFEDMSIILGKYQDIVITPIVYGDLRTPTRDGYNFLGWFKEQPPVLVWTYASTVSRDTRIDIQPDNIVYITVYAWWGKESEFIESQNLQFTLVNDSVYYASVVTASTVTNITLPTTYGEKKLPVYLDITSGQGGASNIYVTSDNPRYTSIDGVLYSEDKTILLLYPDNRSADEFVIPPHVTEIGDNAFISVSLWTETPQGGGSTIIIFSEGLKKIGIGAFINATQIRNDLYLPQSLEYIASSAFAYTRNAGNIYIPKGVKFVGEYAFAGIYPPNTLHIDLPYPTNSDRYGPIPDGWQSRWTGDGTPPNIVWRSDVK
ncbi:MAG: leucine-rich repeat protein [Clostridiales bacterium]|jgi:hypothetical protein|nr:leucine-rich repeat protein [Clostridiales bacterium]